MENDEQQHQTASPGASSAPAAGGHAGRRSQGRLPKADPRLAVNREGVLAAEQPADPSSADWRYLYSLVRERYCDETQRGDGLDQKVGVLLAGAVAAIAFTYANGPTGWWSLVLLVFLVPLGYLFQAFRTRTGKVAPKIDTFANAFPYYPDTTLRVAIDDMIDAKDIDRSLNDKKANRLDLAMATLGLAFLIVLLVQIAWRVTQTPAAPAAASLHTGSRNKFTMLTAPKLVAEQPLRRRGVPPASR